MERLMRTGSALVFAVSSMQCNQVAKRGIFAEGKSYAPRPRTRSDWIRAVARSVDAHGLDGLAGAVLIVRLVHLVQVRHRIPDADGVLEFDRRVLLRDHEMVRPRRRVGFRRDGRIHLGFRLAGLALVRREL